MDIRNTKQKQVILEALKKNKLHPTIQELYQDVLDIDESVGQATVYRNVNRLVEEGKIIKIPTTLGIDHYDADINPHYHLYCEECEKIYDIFDEDYYKLTKRVENEYQVKINKGIILFEGICSKCYKERRNN